jgi:hypothetical protein
MPSSWDTSPLTKRLAGYRLSRRSFLAGALGGSTGLGALFYGGEAVGATLGAIEVAQAWQVASLSNDRFLTEKGAVFTRTVLGCSFAPERWSDQEQAEGSPLRALAFCVQDLGLREIRLAIRWDRVGQANGSVDLAPYRPYLDYCFQHNVNVCLNIGPLRTFRWPEDRVPRTVLSSLGRIPAQGASITWGSPVAEAAMGYLESLMDKLLVEYGSQITGLSSVQPENESFQGFDEHGWTVSSNYMKGVIYLLDQRLPDVPILVTSAGRPALAQITSLFKELLRENQGFRDRLVSGFDYYYATPRHDRIPLHRYLDPIALAFHFPSAKSCAENLKDARTIGFRVEVSEGQAEPYAHITAPGNSIQHFRFMLLRCAERVLDPRETSILRIWGVEELARRVQTGQTTDQHSQIFDLIRRLTLTAA